MVIIAKEQLVTVAIQLEDGSRIIGKYAPQITLWHILNHSQKSSGVNITQRKTEAKKSVPKWLKLNTKGSSVNSGQEKYVEPVCHIVNKQVRINTNDSIDLWFG